MRRIRRYAITGTFALAFLAERASSQCIDFQDADRFKTGSDVSNCRGWDTTTKETAVVSEFSGDDGRLQRFLKITQSSSFNKKVSPSLSSKNPKENVVFFDFRIKPIADETTEPQFTIDICGAEMAFLKEDNSTARFASVKADNGSSLQVEKAFEIDNSNQSVEWIRITIRADLKSRTWDLFLNGSLAVANQKLIGAQKQLTALFYPSPSGAWFLDDFLQSSVNPLFPDADVDGIPDAVEMANGTNAYFDDRSTDSNSDGISNIESFRNGKPLSTSTKLFNDTRRFVYIDNHSGDDIETGESSYKTAEGGPKKSLRGAASVKGNDVVFVLMPSDKPYICPNYPTGKAPNVSYVLLGNATLGGE